MSLRDVRDEFLARRARDGDGVAFAELARRYEPLIVATTRRVPDGLDAEDARQAALIGLCAACRATDGVRSFAGLARLRVRWVVAAARRAACADGQHILTRAVRDGHEPDGALARIVAPDTTQPARVVELREEIYECLCARPDIVRRAMAPRVGDVRRRYGRQRRARALALIADGSTIADAAATVGVPYRTVRTWLIEAPADSPAGRALRARRAQTPHGNLARRFTDAQKHEAVAMLAEGRSLRTAAAAVGATSTTVLRWVRQAA